MSSLKDRIFQAIVAAVAAAAAYFYILPWAKSVVAAVDEKLILAISTALIYIVLLFIFVLIQEIEWLRKRFDKNSIFVGQYLSFPKTVTKSGFLKYGLTRQSKNTC
jgi:hypothetical protein